MDFFGEKIRRIIFDVEIGHNNFHQKQHHQEEKELMHQLGVI